MKSCICIFFMACAFIFPAAQYKTVKTIDLESVDVLQPSALAAGKKFVFILDKSSSSVTRLDLQGEVIRFGKPGAGPGELPRPLTMGIVNNRLWVFNFGGRLVWFDLAGNFQEQHQVFAHNTFFSGKIIEMLSADTYTGLVYRYSKAQKKVCLKYICQNKHTAFTLAELGMSNQTVLNSKLRSTDFAKPLVASANSRIYVVPDVNKLRIRVFDPALNRFVKDTGFLPFVRVGLCKQEKNELSRSIRKITSQSPFVKSSQFVIPTYHQAVKSLVAANNGTVWVVTWQRKAELFKTLIFDSSMNKIEDIYLPDFKLAAFSNLRLYLVCAQEDTFLLRVCR